MVKKKRTPVEPGKGQPIVTSYYAAVGKPSGNKNEEKPLKNDKITLLLAGHNESNDNDCTIRTEKGTIMEPNTAPVDDRNGLELDKEKDKNKEEVKSSGEEDDGSLDELNSKIKNDDKQQELYFNNGTEEATIMGADMEVTNVEVSSSGHNNVEGPDENVGEKSESNTEQMEEGKLDKVKTNINENGNENEQELNTKTEEATIMGADTEVIGASGLQKHGKRFHTKGAAAAIELANVEKSNVEKNVEDLKNDETEEGDTKNSAAGNNMEEEDDYENTKDDTKGSNNNELTNTLEKEAYVIGGDSKSSNPLDSDFAVSSQPTMGDISEGVNIMKDNWEFDDEILEEEDTMDGNKGKTEESTDDKKARKKNPNTIDNLETGGISLFGAGGTRNENQQKDRTNIITRLLIESKTKEEQDHIIVSLATKSVLNVLDDESSDDDDDESIVVNQDVQDKDEHTVLFQNTKL